MANPIDPETQGIYDELNKRGVFKEDKEAQMIGHELRGRGVINDPTQGGLAPPAPSPAPKPQQIQVNVTVNGQPQGQGAVPRAQGGAPPVLPPVTSAPAGTPPAAAPAPGSTGVFGPAPLMLNMGQVDPIINQALPGGLAGQSRAAAPGTAPPQYQAHEVPPSGRRQIPALGFASDPLEHALHVQNEQLDQLHQQLGGNVPHQPYGPVDVMKRSQAYTLAQLNARVPALYKALDPVVASFNAEEQRLKPRLQAAAAGRLSEPQMAQLRQDVHDHNANGQAIQARVEQIKGYQRAWINVAENYRGERLHAGPYLASELNLPQGQGFAGALADVTQLGAAARFLKEKVAPMIPGVKTYRNLTDGQNAARAGLMREGKYPMLPANPGRNPAERAEKDQEARDVRQWFFTNLPGVGLGPKFSLDTAGNPAAINPAVPGSVYGAGGAGKRAFLQAYQHFTPYQKALVPIFQGQMLAERQVGLRAKSREAFEEDAIGGAAAIAGGEAFGEKALGGPLVKFLTEKLGPVEARVLESGLNPWVKKGLQAGLRITPSAVVSGFGGAAATGLSGAAVTKWQGGSWRDAGAQGLRMMPEGFLIGAGIGAAHGGLKAAVDASQAPAPPRAGGKPAAYSRATGATVGPVLRGPTVELADGTTIDLRQTPEPQLREIFANTPSNHPSWKVMEDYLSQHDLHNAGMTAHPPVGSEPEITKAWNNPKNAARRAVDVLRGEAGKTGDPAVGDLLQEAADTMQKSWGVNVVTDLHPEGAPSDFAAPPTASVWRRLSEEQRAGLSKEAQQALLLQDINNSLHVADPTLPHYTQMPKGIKNMADLRTQADLQFNRAQMIANERSAPANARVAHADIEGQTPAAPAAPPTSQRTPEAVAALQQRSQELSETARQAGEQYGFHSDTYKRASQAAGQAYQEFLQAQQALQPSAGPGVETPPVQGNRFEHLEMGEPAGTEAAPAETNGRFEKVEFDEGQGSGVRGQGSGPEPTSRLTTDDSPTALAPPIRPQAEVKPEESGGRGLILQEETKTPRPQAQAERETAAPAETVSTTAETTRPAETKGAGTLPVSGANLTQEKEQEHQPGALFVGKTTGAHLQLIAPSSASHWEARVLEAGTSNYKTGQTVSVSGIGLRTAYTQTAGNNGAAQQRQPQTGGGASTSTGTGTGTGTSTSTGAHAEPWQQTQDEFIKSHWDKQVFPADLLGNMGMARVAETGKPGYQMEQTQPTERGDTTKAVVYRDEHGVARGTLEFSAPGEALGVNKRASVLGIHVDPAFRRQGIGTKLQDFLDHAGYEPQALEEKSMTEEGARLYHARAVAQAVAQGKPVPANVLAEYPKLAQGGGSQTAEKEVTPEKTDSSAAVTAAHEKSLQAHQALVAAKTAYREAPAEKKRAAKKVRDAAQQAFEEAMAAEREARGGKKAAAQAASEASQPHAGSSEAVIAQTLAGLATREAPTTPKQRKLVEMMGNGLRNWRSPFAFDDLAEVLEKAKLPQHAEVARQWATSIRETEARATSPAGEQKVEQGEQRQAEEHVEGQGEKTHEQGHGLTSPKEQPSAKVTGEIHPQIGSAALNPGVEVVDGPLDGYVAEVLEPGLRTVDEVLRKAKVRTTESDPRKGHRELDVVQNVEEEPRASTSTKEERAPLQRLMGALGKRLQYAVINGAPFFKNNPALMKFAEEHLGGSLADGTFTTQDVYDALEAAVNRMVSRKQLRGEHPDVALAQLRELLAALPTQTARTEEKVEFQQFSTPPTIAYVAAWALNPQPGEKVLEPSAGTGSLAAAAQSLGGVPVVNEIAPRRLELLKYQGYTPTSANAERLNSTLPSAIRATAILMNPPFSATGGRVAAHDNKYGMRHLEEALKRLLPGGRLVAIMGRGMSFDHPTAARWWAEILPKYNVRANISMPGAEYRKYGTSFDNQLIIIDHTGPTPGATGAQRMNNVVTGAPETLAGVVELINERGLRNRPPVAAAAEESRSDQGPTAGNTVGGSRGQREVSANGSGSHGSGQSLGSDHAPGTSAGQSLGEALPTGESQPAHPRAAHGGTQNRGIGTAASVDPQVVAGAILDRTLTAADAAYIRSWAKAKGYLPRFIKQITESAGALQRYLEKNPAHYVARQIVGELGLNYIAPTAEALEQRKAEALAQVGQKAKKPGKAAKLDQKTTDAANEAIAQANAGAKALRDQAAADEGTPPPQESAGSVFVDYAPQYAVEGKPHPGHIVTTGALGAVEKPPITYAPVSLDPQSVEKGAPSNIQIEALSYIFQRFEQTQRDGRRAGFLLGDGTGVGKGITMASVVKEYAARMKAQGKAPKILWLSVSANLKDAAADDLAMINTAGIPLHLINEFDGALPIDLKEGIVFSTYTSFIHQSKGDKKGKFAGKYRREQIQEWLGDEPLILYDEAHKLKNAMATAGGEPSITAQQAREMDQALPLARVVYSSATGATELRNMAYMSRLGLWGTGTAFPGGVAEFMAEIGKGGVGALELVSRDLVSVGAMLSRNLSYEGVEYAELKHELTPDQREMYDAAASAWREVQERFADGLAITNANAQKKNKLNNYFWATHQRFFRMLITAMKTPAALQAMEQSLKDGKAVIISLIGTNEGAEEKKTAQAIADEIPLDELDFSPREMLIHLVNQFFPVHNYEEKQGEDGKVFLALVEDEHGNLEENPEALELRNRVLEHLSQLYLPENPLDQIIQHFGHENVAELTGRKKRREWHNGKMVRVSRKGAEGQVKNANLQEMKAFQSGKKLIAVLSKAADTGISLHASNRAANQRQRHFYTLELNWSADAQLQTFGRAHRTDQANAPKFILVSSDVGGEARFSSTIARRLASLGAITRGQREASAGKGDKLADKNFETEQGEAAIAALYKSMMSGPVPGIENPHQVLIDMGIVKVNKDGEETIKKEAMTDVPKFLNRVLALPIAVQNTVFEHFYTTFRNLVAYAKAHGEFDEGVTDVKALHTRLETAPTVIPTGLPVGKTSYVPVQTEELIKPVSWALLNQRLKDLTERRQNFGTQMENHFFKDPKTGKVVYAQPLEPKDGKARYVLHRPNGWRWKYVGQKDMETLDNGYVHIPYNADAIRANWEEQIQNLPKTETHTYHLITGTLLPLWKRLTTLKGGTGPMKTMRFQTDEGQRIVGVAVPADRVREVMAGLNVGLTQITPEEVYDGVVNNGQEIPLEGGMKVAYRAVFGRQVVEIVGVNGPTTARVLKGLGVTNQQDYNGKARFWIPAATYAQELEVLKRVLDNYPVFDPGRAATEEKATPAGFRPGFFRPSLSTKGKSAAGGGQGGKPPQGPDKDDTFGLDDDRWEWFNRNRGASRKKAATSWKEWWTRLWNRYTRTYEGLPHTGRYKPVRELLRQVERGRNIANNRALIELSEILQGLTDPEYKLFNMTVLLRDINEEMARQRAQWEEAHPAMDPADFRPETPGPWKSEAEAARDLLAIEPEIGKYPKVQDALAKRRSTATAVVTEYEAARAAAGYKPAGFDRTDYFRHLVLEFVTQNGEGGGRSVEAPMRRGHLKARTGSFRDIETGFVEAEMNIYGRLMTDAQLFRLVAEVKKFDLTNSLKRAAIEHNDAEVLQLFGHMADEMNARRGPGAPLVTDEELYRRLLNWKQAAGFDSLGRMAHKGLLPDDNGRFRDLIDEIAENWRIGQQRAALGQETLPLDPAFSKQMFEYAGWLLKEQGGQAGSGAAGLIFKGIREKKAAIAGMLGDELVTAADMMKQFYPDHVEWQPLQGNVFFRATTLDQRVVQEIMDQVGTKVAVGAGDLGKVRAMGREYPSLIIPRGLAETLDGLFEVPKKGPEVQAAQGVMKGWKLWTLFNPQHYAGYMTRNTVTDIDAMFVGNPHGFLKLGQGLREVANFYVNKTATPEFKDWVARGGLEGRLQSQEGIGNTRGLDILGKYLGNPEKLNPFQQAKALAKAYALVPNDFREAAIRYSNYLSFLDQMANDKAGRPRSWGASLPEEILALPDPRDRAYALSNELIGAYDQVTQGGRFLRQNLMPFWSWKEMNARRYYRLAANSLNNPRAQVRFAASTLGKTALGAHSLAMVGGFGVKALAMIGAMDYYNNRFHRDAERLAPDYIRGKPHMIVTNPLTGNPAYVSGLGGSQDVLAWFGLDNVMDLAGPVMNGHMTVHDAMREYGRRLLQTNPIAEFGKGLYQALGPVRTIPEMVAGETSYPDPTHPRAVKDRLGALAKVLNLDAEYKQVRGIPQPTGQVLGKNVPTAYMKTFFGINEFDPGDSAYQETRGTVRQFLADRGLPQEPPGGGVTAQADALYLAHQAMRFGDTGARDRYLLKYAQLGGTDDGLKESLKAMNPVGKLTKNQLADFVKGLSMDDAIRVRRALWQYQSMVAPKLAPEILRQLTREPDLLQFLRLMNHQVEHAIDRGQPIRREIAPDNAAVRAEAAKLKAAKR